jgi:hypothetical protein
MDITDRHLLQQVRGKKGEKGKRAEIKAGVELRDVLSNIPERACKHLKKYPFT